MQVIRTDRFEHDLIEHFAVIAENQPAAAERFAAAVAELLQALGEFPQHGRAWESPDPKLAGVRLRKVPGYGVLIFYHIKQDTVVVLCALHGSRDDLAEILVETIGD